MNPVVRSFKHRLAIPILVAALGLMLAGQLPAQILTVLHSFTHPSLGNNANTDGATPYAGLDLSGGKLYGTAMSGGTFANGTVFSIGIDGTDFKTLHNFTAAYTNSQGHYTNGDGVAPRGTLVLSGNVIYGTATAGGNWGSGTVFKVNTDGSNFTTLYHFTETTPTSCCPFVNSDGFGPRGLILSSTTLYGTTYAGGVSGVGAVFALKTDGTGFTNLHSFDGSDGGSPNDLILSSNTLYGTGQFGGSSFAGTVFALKTDGTGFTNLHSFTSLNNDTNSDGIQPYGGLVLWSNTLYGTASAGGSSSNGTVFAVNIDSTGFLTVHNFKEWQSGIAPRSTLVLSGNALYGTTTYGGASSVGTVFTINTDGTAFRVLHSFGPDDGVLPQASLILSSNILYGTTIYGGSAFYGSVFSLFIQPQLTLIPYGPYVILTWPTNYTGFNLETATNLLSSAWTTNSQGPVVIGDQNVVIDTVSGNQRFFRLSQ